MIPSKQDNRLIPVSDLHLLISNVMYQYFYRLWNQRQTYAIRSNNRRSWYGNRIIWEGQIVFMDLLSDMDSVDNHSSLLFCSLQWTISSTSGDSSWLIFHILIENTYDNIQKKRREKSYSYRIFIHWTLS